MKHLFALVVCGTMIVACSQMKSPEANAQESQHKEVGKSAKERGLFVPPGGSRDSDETGTRRHITVKVSGADNGGALAVLEVPTARDAGPSLHTHHVENEWFYALEGEYDIQVGAEIFHLKPGGSVYGPKLVPHTWHDVGETSGRMLVVAQPAGHIEAFVKDLEKMTTAELRVPGAEKALLERHNMEIAGPPLPKMLLK